MERVFSSVTEIVNGLGVGSEAKAALVMGTWSHVAGEMLSSRTEAVAYNDGRLSVAVKDLTWKKNLEALAPQMVAKLNARLGERTVSFIEFRIAKPHPGAANKHRREPVEVSQKLLQAAEQIDDPDLRETFLSAAAEYLKRR